MKNVIRLSESELIEVIKKVISESGEGFNPKTWGCRLFSHSSESREWCENNQFKFMNSEYKKVVQIELDYIADFLESQEDEKYSNRIQKFDPSVKIYESNIADVKDIYEKLKNCQNARVFISKKAKEFVKSKMFTTPEQTYDLLNKLNTNYSALAYLITNFRQKNNLEGEPFNYVFDKYFRVNPENPDNSPFFKDVEKILVEDDDINKNMVYHTIRQTSLTGNNTEEKFHADLWPRLGKENIKHYSGDFSWVDFMGVDMLVNLNGEWIPVQIKTKLSDCEKSANIRNFCKNWCVAPSSPINWTIQVYDGKSKIAEHNDFDFLNKK